MRRVMLLAALAALALPAPVLGQRSGQAQQRDWTQVVSPTPEGGFRMGNPQAAVRVVEFLSLTCPHCAEFSRVGTPRLMTYVRSGRVSIEYRNFVLNGLDLAAAFLSRCASPRNYFALTDDLLRNQQQWVGRMQALSAAQQREMQGQQPLETMRRVVAAAGIDAFALRHGLTPAQQSACLANQAGLDRVVEMQQAGSRFGVSGTPTFAVNGRIAASVHDWAGLEPLLRGR